MRTAGRQGLLERACAPEKNAFATPPVPGEGPSAQPHPCRWEPASRAGGGGGFLPRWEKAGDGPPRSGHGGAAEGKGRWVCDEERESWKAVALGETLLTGSWTSRCLLKRVLNTPGTEWLSPRCALAGCGWPCVGPVSASGSVPGSTPSQPRPMQPDKPTP